MRIVHAVLRCCGIVAVAASAAAACAKSPTSPVAGTWTIDASPFPGYMLVADRVRLQVVVIDSVGGLRPATEGSVMTVSDTRILQLRGDTLIAMSMGRGALVKECVIGVRRRAVFECWR